MVSRAGMRVRQRFYFLKPRWLSVLLTLVVLCLPLLREQYNQGEFVTWHRPIDLLAYSLKEPGNFQLFFIVLEIASVIYFFLSLAIAGISKYLLPAVKKIQMIGL